VRSGERKERVSVLAASRHEGKRPETIVLGFRSPRATLLGPIGLGLERALATALLELGGEDPTVLVANPEDGRAVEEAVRRARPAAEVFAYDPAQVLKFLWFFRDKEEPLFLGHAAERPVLDETYPAREPPPLSGVKRAELGRSVAEVRRLLMTMGNALGVKPPLPHAGSEPGAWGARRLAAALRSCCGLYAGLLLRWGAPIVRRVDEPGALPRIVLADAWLAARLRTEG
jgi:hypothetical protein